MKTCLYRIEGKFSECKKCEIDYEDCYLNNHDCTNYYLINLRIYKVKKTELNELPKIK